MLVLVTNIPRIFRTPDLRNFFSQAIEEGTFNCFHFRHRPHENIISLLHKDFNNQKNLVPQEEEGTQNDLRPSESSSALVGLDGRRKCEFCQQSHLKSDAGKENSNKTLGSNLVLELDKGDHNDKGDSGTVTGVQSEETLVRTGSSSEEVECNNRPKVKECTCISKLELSKEDNESEKDNSSPSKGDQSHWLSSGLSGLTSLIKETKQKASKKNKCLPNNGINAIEQSSEKQLSQSVTQTKSTELKPDPGPLRNFNNLTLSNEGSLLDSADGTCCIIDVKENYVEKFQSLYQKKYWVDRTGDVFPQQCLIIRLNLEKPGTSKYISDTEKDYKTRGDLELQRPNLTDLNNLIELRPPPVMPQGNVGTPTLHFQNLIRTCQLPGTIIAKLGLQFPRTRGKKRFGQVPFDYGTKVHSGSLENQERFVAFTATGHHIPGSFEFKRPTSKPRKKLGKSGPSLELEKEAEDGAEVEEWERYEAYHDDVTSQDRTKERLYEKEIELVWEKGGPGLVFYTDAQYWREQEGDFDEQTADEWDVDLSVYYEKGAGDRDALDSVGMVESNNLRSGALMQSAFTAANKRTSIDGSESDKKRIKDSGKRRKIGPAAPPKIGRFEAHTRGFGRRLLESQGWTDGLGLGRQSDGLPYALGNDGQHPQDKKGIGYHGEKFEGWGKSSKSSSRQFHQHSTTEQSSDCEVRISTVFDAPRDVDPSVSHLRTSEPTRLSHRHDRIAFSKASKSTL